MYNAKAQDNTYCRDNVKRIVNDIKAKNKYAVWIPIEGNLSFNYMDKCQAYIHFTNIAPQPHYYQVRDDTGYKYDSECQLRMDPYRPNGMNFNQLKIFMQECKNRGWGVEFECDNAVREDYVGGSRENCGCQCMFEEDLRCTDRAVNYYCASNAVGGFKYVYHYFSNDIQNYLKVKERYNEISCPSGGNSTC
ncbi:hypothetical protein APY94_12035 [Thermococcus celericrescens]|uniref:Uncharacterized protein n=2 Tax=Thermococcus celericrescens TaxID=227598 RepID=A0A100XVX2_9EURY|nr:hypothetical protein APY94_12035 [Thermococcus celericrescens]